MCVCVCVALLKAPLELNCCRHMCVTASTVHESVHEACLTADALRDGNPTVLAMDRKAKIAVLLNRSEP